ncbi:MAG: hypothetical protein HYT47_01335 [Candidatus Vogelbacteria bacterium]|nr:hypothetical protein [Candidatus Vogelbacteria bacterium]
MTKRLIILIVILIVLLAGVGIWWWVASRAAPPAAPPVDLSQAFPVSPPRPPAPVTGTTSITSLATTPIPETPSYRSNRLITLSERAVAGVTIIPAATSTESDRVLFLERETGLIVEMALAERARRELARLPLRAPLAETILTLDSQKLSVWFSTIASTGQKNYFSGAVNLDSGATDSLTLPEIESAPLGDAVQNLTLAPGRDRLFTLERVGQETIGKVLDLKIKKSQLVFNSRANQWLVHWPEKNLIALTSKPTAEAPGYLYLLNLRNADWQKIFGGVNGLATLVSPDGQKILYSRSNGRGLELGLYDRLKNESRTLAIATLPEKCVWAGDAATIYCAVPRSLPRATYPDDWLAGEIIFDDLLWQINVESGVSRLSWADEPGLGDVINLLTVRGGEKFIFIDRLTSRLFLIDPVRNFVSNGVDELIPPPLAAE